MMMGEIQEWPIEKLEELKKENEKLTKTVEFLKQTAMVEYLDQFTLESNEISGNVFTMDNLATSSSDIIVKLKLNGQDFSYTYEIPRTRLEASNRLSEIMSLFSEALGKAITTWVLKHIKLRDI